MIRRPPRSTPLYSSAASDVYKRQVVTNPNCTTIMMAVTLKPLVKFNIEKIYLASMQAISGAGYDGVPSMAILDNVIPYIGQEEEKVESETRKLLGEFNGSEILDA